VDCGKCGFFFLRLFGINSSSTLCSLHLLLMRIKRSFVFVQIALLSFTAPLHDWDAVLSRPAGVAFSPSGTIALVDTGNNRVILTEANLDFRFELGPDLEYGPALSHPLVCCFDSNERFILCDSGNSRVLVFDSQMRLQSSIHSLRGALMALKRPASVLADRQGRLIVGDAALGRLFVFEPSGKFTGQSIKVASPACSWLPNGDLAIVRPSGCELVAIGYQMQRGIFQSPLRPFSVKLKKPVTHLCSYGEYLLVREGGDVSLFSYPPRKKPVRRLSPELYGQLSPAGQISVNKAGLLAIADPGNNRFLLIPASLALDPSPKIAHLTATSVKITWTTSAAVAPEFPFNTDQPEWDLWERRFVKDNPRASPLPPRAFRQMGPATPLPNVAMRRSFTIRSLKPDTEYRFRVCTSGCQITDGRISRQFSFKTPPQR
jgi:hypothetical protein